MAPTRSLALLCALLLAASCTSSAASDAPFLVAHKKVALTRPKPGVERLAVSLDLYNQGSATAYDVTINDDSWPKEVFELVSGEVSKTLERLEPGSTASHVFVLETKAQGRFQGSPAVIKYRVPTKAVLQEAYSTPILPLDILAERPPVQKFEFAKKLVAKYGALVSVVSFVLAFIYLVASPSKSGGAKAGKKRR
ncbi:translocon-associated protein subunit beta-like [Lolium rigidum]|uniref:translocon-associated protein subunit beta-like n=1 Tax=Lolium rigidum TaxID=89674 RepID=UPI001F5E16EB|nr:translocon-associated protein subunit beta-like [Lolium rigidum]